MVSSFKWSIVCIIQNLYYNGEGKSGYLCCIVVSIIVIILLTKKSVGLL